MIHIQPISESDATEEIQRVYNDLKRGLQLKSIPYYFQIIAAYPDFLSFLWLKLRPYITNPELTKTIEELILITEKNLAPVIAQDQKISLLMAKITPEEKGKMLKKFKTLQKLNASLLLISIMVRESIKGLPMKKTGSLEIQSGAKVQQTSNLINLEESELSSAQSAISFVQFGDPLFYAYMQLVAQLMNDFGKTKDYLSVRVILENKAQDLIRNLPQNLQLSYGEAVKILFDQPNVDELIYLLHDAFPGYFPKQFLSAVALEIYLAPKNSLATQNNDIIA